MIEAAALIVFPLLMIFAAVADLFTMTIPNRVSIILIIVYFGLAFYLHFPWDVIALHASCGLAMLLLTFVFFHFRWIGGGDAKLASATALWLGWDQLFDYGIVASLFGGVLTLLIVELRRHDLPKRVLALEFIARLAEKTAGVPYGIALALAGLLVYPQTSVWGHLAGLK